MGKKDNDWINDPDVINFLERLDEQSAEFEASNEDDKPFTVAGLSNDKEKSFMKFQNKINNKWRNNVKTAISFTVGVSLAAVAFVGIIVILMYYIFS